MRRRSLHRFLDELLLAVAPDLTPEACEEVAGIRVSDANLQKLASHVAESDRIWESHAIIGPWLRSLPDGLFTDMDDAARRQHGVYRIQLGDIHDGLDRTKRVGFAAIARAQKRFALVLLVHHSASQADVETMSGPRNSWADLFTGAWEWASQCLLARFGRDDRMNRSIMVYALIFDAIKSRAGGRYFLGDIQINPHTDAWQSVIIGQKSSDEVEVGKVRRLAGRLTKLSIGAWPFGAVPVGAQLASREDVRGELQPNKAAGLEADVAHALEFTQVLTDYVAGTSGARIALTQARLGARDRHGALLLPRVMPLLRGDARTEIAASLAGLQDQGILTGPEADRCRTALEIDSNAGLREKATSVCTEYVRRILDARNTLRTGIVQVMIFGAIEGRTEYLGWLPTFVAANSTTTSRVQTICEADLGASHPYWRLSDARKKKAQTHGFWLTEVRIEPVVTLSDEQWAAIEMRRTDSENTIARRRASGQRRPLGGLRWHDANGDYRIGQGGERETYRIANAEGAHLHTVGSTQAARALGELLHKLVQQVETAPLPLLPPVADSAQSRRTAWQQRIDGLLAELVQIEREMTGLHRDRSKEQAGTRQHRLLSEQIAILDANADSIEGSRLPALRARLAGNELEANQEIIEEVSGDMAHLAVTAEALMRCDGVGSAALHDAVTWLLDSGGGLSNMRAGAHERQILIDVRVRLPLADGTIGLLEAGTLDLTDRRLSPPRMQEYIADVARRLLRDRESIDSLCDRFNWPASEILEAVASWLSRHTKMPMYLRAAVVTAAAAGGDLPVGRVVYAHATADLDAIAALRQQPEGWIVTQIEKAYVQPDSRWAKNASWVRGPLAACRAAMASIAQDGPTRRNALISSVEGIRNDEHLHDLLSPGRRSLWQPPLLLDDGWVRAHVCRFDGCPGGGTAAMTGFLAVPELLITNDAVFCRFCWRTLTTGGVLPGPYRHFWDVTSNATALRRTDGIPTIAEPPVPPVRAATPLRSRDVAKELGLKVHEVSRLAREGRIPSSMSSTGKLVFTAQGALSPTIRQRYGHPASPIDPRDVTSAMTSERAALRLGTTATIVRMLARQGVLENIAKNEGRARYKTSAVEEILASVQAQTGRPNATLADLARLSELGGEWGLNPLAVRNVVAAGVVAQVLVGSLTWVDRASVDELDERARRALDPAIRMSTEQVARRAGLSPATVLYHRTKGGLPSVQLWADGAVWFLPEEVERWAASRGAA